MIRSARPSDVPVIAGLIRQLARYERLEHEVVGTEADLQRHLFGERPFAEVLLAEDASRTVGFALFFHNYSTFLARPGIYLEDLFVLPEHRRRGFGRALLSAVARLAAERGCGRFEWSVLDWNEPAIAFYEALGAVVMHEWRILRVTGPVLGALAALGPPISACPTRPSPGLPDKEEA
jgi:GNAT superfamily N-acetyltransferase